MSAIASQITSLMIVYSTVYSDADQRKHQSSAALAFVPGEFPAQRAGNVEKVSIWWRHHGYKMEQSTWGTWVSCSYGILVLEHLQPSCGSRLLNIISICLLSNRLNLIHGCMDHPNIVLTYEIYPWSSEKLWQVRWFFKTINESYAWKLPWSFESSHHLFSILSRYQRLIIIWN